MILRKNRQFPLCLAITDCIKFRFIELSLAVYTVYRSNGAIAKNMHIK